MNINETARYYFNCFEKKDINSLAKLFHSNVCLKDWNVNVKGIKSVLDVNKEIFNSVKNLSVHIENLYLLDLTVIAELKIHANGEDVLPVVDIITFCKEGDKHKIKSITAYRGN